MLIARRLARALCRFTKYRIDETFMLFFDGLNKEFSENHGEKLSYLQPYL